MGDTARVGLRRCGLRHVAWLLVLMLAACAQPHSVPTAPSTQSDAAAASNPQIAAIPPEPLMPAYKATRKSVSASRSRSTSSRVRKRWKASMPWRPWY